MDAYELPGSIEPTYWNVVFHPSQSRIDRLFLGRFKHVSAFTYIPGFKVWIIYDCQWGGTRISFFSSIATFVCYTHGCTIVKFDRIYKPMILASRFGFYCVPAIKNLLGLSCVAATPDGLYRHLINNGGEPLGQRVEPSPAAAGSVAATGTRAGAG